MKLKDRAKLVISEAKTGSLTGLKALNRFVEYMRFHEGFDYADLQLFFFRTAEVNSEEFEDLMQELDRLDSLAF